ncbi:MAG TPA: hypothetical protein VEK08_15335 [Planctomycetota bacterium]|nr:hypothetical protein [Planctomycetota bacterium]
MRTRSTRTSRPLNVAGKPVKSRQSFAHADQLARVNPDAAARQLLRSNALLKNSKQRAELWSLLQNLGGDAVVARASKAILTTRHTDELQAVLSAASADCWNGTASAIEARFHRECARAKESDSELLQRLRALAAAAISLDATLEAADLRRLLKSPVSATRAIGAEIVARQSRWDLVLETLPLCWDRGEARIFAGQALGVMGGEEHAAELWSRALAARKANRQRLLHHLLKILGAMGAFDIQLPLKFWIEDDVASNEAATTRNPWFYGTLWSRLLSAKLGAGAATREEALEELRWFVRVAGPELPRVPGAASNPDRFDVAQTFVLLGAESEAEELLKRFASRGLPSPAEYPKLLFASLRPHVEADTTPAGVAWLAASGDEAARKKVLDGFAAALKQGQRPEHWELRDFFDREQIAAIARQALHQQPAGTLRQILALLYAEHSASLVKDCVTRLARTHSSSVVQWKARQLREALKNTTQPRLHPRAIDYSFQRWVRLDAAILSGALRPGHAPKAPPKEESHPPSGILKPVRAGQGYLLSTAGLSAESRRQTIKELLSNSLSKALQRELPLGPSLEERPDIKAVREPAPPQNELDEHMAELAQAVMSMWNEADEALTLDEEGLRLMAAALSTEARVLDEDDLEACGAFIGEVLRKRVGGSWTGYDDNYRLEIPVPSSVIAGEEGESMEVLVFDPLGWAREINMRKDVVEGTQLLLENFQHALNKAKPQSAALKFHVNPSQAFEAAIMKLGDLPPLTPMTELLAEARAFVFRLLPEEWPAVLAALEPLIEGTWVRVAASFAIYAPGEAFCRLWARWGAGKMKDSAFVDAIIEAIGAVIERDDLEAMPHWTIQPAQSRHAFLHPLRKRMPREMWRKVLQLLLRQRAGAGDRAGVSWCLYSYKYEFPDVLPLVELFCALSVSARQTLLRSTVHATMDERKLFRPLWAEALRDPAPAVVLSALEAVAVNNVRSLRALVQALTRDKRESIADAASEVLGAWEG